MNSRSTKALAIAVDNAVDRAALSRPELSTQEVALFCNILGVGPRQLAKCREEITERYDLGPRGAWIVGLIELGVDSPSGLTEALCIGRSLVTAEINRLAQAGLIAGNQSTQDGRRIVLALTEKGWKVSKELRATINEFVSSRLAGYSREQVLECLALLQDFVGGARIGDFKD